MTDKDIEEVARYLSELGGPPPPTIRYCIKSVDGNSLGGFNSQLFCAEIEVKKKGVVRI